VTSAIVDFRHRKAMNSAAKNCRFRRHSVMAEKPVAYGGNTDKTIGINGHNSDNSAVCKFTGFDYS